MPLVKEGRAAIAHVLLLKPDEVGTKWFETHDGKWIRFRGAERRDQRQLVLDECRDRVEQDLRSQKRTELIEKLQESLRKKYNVVVHQPPATQPEESKS